MQPLINGQISVFWARTVEAIFFQFNPGELSFQKNVQHAEIAIPGLDSPLLQFVRGQAETLALDLFFDSTEDGIGVVAKSITERTDMIYSLVKIDPNTHAPPVCYFSWNSEFPGFRISKQLDGQQRSAFWFVADSVKHKYTMFNPLGVPLRATVTVSMKEYKSLEQQLSQLKLNSPDRTQVRVVQSGDTLQSIAADHYRRPAEWRLIASANNLDDPRRLAPGAFLTLPPMP
jgi:hypothetical protein